MSETLNHLLHWFAQNTDSFWNQTGDFPYECISESFTQKKNQKKKPIHYCVFLDMCSVSPVTLFETIFVDKIVQNQAAVF